MKKILLVMMVVAGAATYGRDFEYNGRRDVERYIKKGYEADLERAGRSICRECSRGFDSDFGMYSEFHRELDTQDRGHQDR